MTNHPATWLPDALRTDPVVAPKVIVVPGFETRGRPGSFFPSGIVDHHTACFARPGHDPRSCLNGILAGNTVAPGPISQLLVTLTAPGTRWNGNNLDPHIIVIAAGRSNHAGNGNYPWGAPSGNGSSIGIEGCGPMNPWPADYVDFRARCTAAILRHRQWGTHQVTTHHEYAGARKIDPSGPTPAQPGLAHLEPWHAPTWRRTVDQHLTPPTPPTTEHPEPEEDTMQGIVAIYTPTPAMQAQGLNKSFALLPNGDVRHATGPDTELGRPSIPIRGLDHYNDCIALDAVYRARSN